MNSLGRATTRLHPVVYHVSVIKVHTGHGCSMLDRKLHSERALEHGRTRQVVPYRPFNQCCERFPSAARFSAALKGRSSKFSMILMHLPVSASRGKPGSGARLRAPGGLRELV